MIFSVQHKLLYVVTVIGAAACSSRDAGGEGGVVDDVGRIVSLEAPWPRRSQRSTSESPPEELNCLTASGRHSTVNAVLSKPN